MLFIKLVWWIRTYPIFKKFDQAKMFLLYTFCSIHYTNFAVYIIQILLYTLSNVIDSTNLIKLIWWWASNESWLVHLSICDSFNPIHHGPFWLFSQRKLKMIYQWKLKMIYQWSFVSLFASFHFWFVSLDMTMVSFLWPSPASYVN